MVVLLNVLFTIFYLLTYESWNSGSRTTNKNTEKLDSDGANVPIEERKFIKIESDLTLIEFRIFYNS